MNSWVRRSLQASLIAGGFVVLGAGVANAAEPGQAPDLGQTSQGIVGNVTHAAKGTVDKVTKQVPATPIHKSGTPTKAQQARPAKQPTRVAPADGVRSATGEVTKTTGKLLGNKGAAAAPKQVHKARTLPAPGRDASTRYATKAADITGVANGTVDSLGIEELPATAGANITPLLAVTDTAGPSADVVGTATGAIDETAPFSADLGDLGNGSGITGIVGNAEGMTHLTGDQDGLSGITSVNGVLASASSLTAEVPGVATVVGSSTTASTVSGVLAGTADLSEGNVTAFANAAGDLVSFSALDIDAGDLGYLSTTASVIGGAAATGVLLADLESGDVSGLLTAIGAVDGVVTADGQVADIAGLSGVATASAFVDGLVTAVGNVRDGDLSGAASLLGTLDATADGSGWVTGLGDASLSATASSIVQGSLDLLEVSL